MPQHQVGQDFNQVVAVQPPCHPDRQTLPRILVDQRQQPQGSAVVRAGAYKIVGPNVILALRPQSHATAIIQPQPASRPLFLRYFQPFAAPDPLHPVFAYRPTRCAQQSRNPPIAIASVGAGQLQDGSRQPIFIFALAHPITLRSSPLPQQPARTPLR